MSNPADHTANAAELARLRQQAARERKARLEAERIAEQATRQLYDEKASLLLLQAITGAANEANNFEEAIRIALDRICAHTGWPVGHVYLLSEGTTGDLVSARLWHLREPERCARFREASEQLRFTPGLGLPGRVLSTGQPAWLRDAPSDSNFPRAEMAREIGLRSGMAFPLLVGTSIVGVMEFFADEAKDPDPRLLEIMTHLGAQLGRVVERERARKALELSEAYFRRLTDNALDLITILEADGTIRYESHSIETVLGFKPEEYRGKNAFEFVHPEDVPPVSQAFQEALVKHGNTQTLTFRFRHKDGSYRILEGMGNNLMEDPIVAGIIFNSRDVTERKKLEGQFLQSQKVQAIGQLAGGVAHDFNNILTAILGYSDLMLKQLPPQDSLRLNAEEIKKAANRAASLTRQLLAFSRKQVLQPRVLDLNGIVADMDKMLRRLLGEHIDLVTIPLADLGRVKADPGQIEQVVMNLAVNARDAMSNHGKLTVETANVTLDADYAATRPEVTPGEYVMIAVSDNGSGMPPEVKARLFEPFFTTKGQGQGTGLGLATCHGIVKQSGGHIAVYSEVGRGTTFKVYLPRVHEALEAAIKREQPTELRKGNETVLLVEDEPMLRELGLLVLSGLGYRVLPADNGVQALRLLEQHRGQDIHLLVTDVVMPEMGGKELAERLREISPRTRVIFCSGYTEDAIVHDGELERGVSFVQKPYTVAMLAGKVREVLELAP